MTSTQILDLLQQAVGLHQAGRLAEADQLYDRVLKSDHKNADALNLKGVIAAAQGRQAEALKLFDRSITARATFPDAHFNRANTLAALDRAEDALAGYERAISLRPDYADAYVNAGLLLRKLKRPRDSLAVFRRMAQRHHNDPRAHYGIATAIAADNILADAVESLRLALKLKPDWPQAWNDLGTYLGTLDDADGALAAYDRAIALEPSYSNPIVNKGLILLSLGRFGEGFDGYARRLEDSENPFRPAHPPQWPWPEWRGEDLAGKRILLWHDQGIGDAILLASMVPEVAAAAQVCTLVCDARLVPLVQRAFPNVDVFAQADAPDLGLPPDKLSAGFDFHSTLLNLGRSRRRTLAAFPNRAAFLRADAERSRDLRRRYLADTPPGTILVGLSWRSANPVIGAEKSMALQEFLPLFANRNVRFVNLQYGDTREEVAALDAIMPARLTTDTTIDSFADLAGLADQIAALDLVITVSNTTAHIAGALGIPTWLMVPAGRPRLWYWLREGNYCPWYQSVRLFRKTARDETWSPIVATITDLISQVRVMCDNPSGTSKTV